jgi:hypothetical protein
MTRMSKQGERRAKSFRKPKLPGVKTGPKKDKLPLGFKEHINTINEEASKERFFPKI